MSISVPLKRRVLLVDGGSDAVDAARMQLVSALLERGHDVSCVRAERVVAGIEPPGQPVMIVGRFGGDAPVAPSPDVQFLDLDCVDPSSVLSAMEAAGNGPASDSAKPWKPWFPVIDYSRCTNCMQCLSFCLFDVYGVSADSKIQVQNQSNCKTDCPACSRVCPEVAIMFPKYRHGPINGDEVAAEDVRREAMKVDISALLGGDIYALLRDRSAKAKSRFSKERDDERALKERQNCLIALQRDLDVPAEVLAALPSADEIRLKSEAARARARQATENLLHWPAHRL